MNATVTRIHPDDDLDVGQYSAAEVCSLTGVTYRQLDYWITSGRLPDPRPRRGSGHRHAGYGRIFDDTTIHLIAAAAQLVAAGVGHDLAFRTARHLADHGTWHADLGCLAITVTATPPTPEETP